MLVSEDKLESKVQIEREGVRTKYSTKKQTNRQRFGLCNSYRGRSRCGRARGGRC